MADQRRGALEALWRCDPVLRADDKERRRHEARGSGRHVGAIAKRCQCRADRGHGRLLNGLPETCLQRAAAAPKSQQLWSEQARHKRLGGDPRSPAADPFREIDAAGADSGRVGLEFRVDQHDPAEAVWVAGGEMLDDIAPHREATGDDGLVAPEGVEDRHDLVGHTGDRGRRRTIAAAEAGQIGGDQPGRSVERPPRRHERPLPVPHGVVEGKAVEEDDRDPRPGLPDHDPAPVGERRQERFGDRL